MAETEEHDKAMNGKRSISILVVAWALLCPSFLSAASFEDKVVGISDGDTIKILKDGKPGQGQARCNRLS